MPELTDRQLIQLYSQWSEDAYCAGFISPSESHVKQFRRWLKGPKPPNWDTDAPLADYEKEMVEIFRRQEANE